MTVAATDNNPLHGGSLLAVYALGTVIPLFGLALLWDRLDLGRQRWLRGFGVQVGALRIHSTNLIAGVLFIALGVSFILLDGTNALSAQYADLGFEEASFEADVWVKNATDWIPDTALLALGALGAAFAAYRIISWMRPGDDDGDDGTFADGSSHASQTRLGGHDGAGSPDTSPPGA